MVGPTYFLIKKKKKKAQSQWDTCLSHLQVMRTRLSTFTTPLDLEIHVVWLHLGTNAKFHGAKDLITHPGLIKTFLPSGHNFVEN